MHQKSLIVADSLVGVTVSFLFLQDSLWEKLPLETNKIETLQFYRNETQFIHNYLTEVAAAPATVSIQLLQHIARLRLTLTMAAQLICDKCSGEI